MTNPAPTPLHNWRPTLVLLGALLIALVVLYRDTAIAMVGIWARSETFTHAFLVPPISAWLIWERRSRLIRFKPRPTLWLALPLAVIGFGWLLGNLAAVNAITQLTFTCMFILLVPLVIGIPAARQITFPLAFLLFAVPIGEFVMPTLMDWTAAVTVLCIRASGIPVFQEGLHFVIPSGRWSVIEACSGVRYLIASLTVGTLFAYLNFQSLRRRLIFVVVAILVPIAANWIRAYMIVMLGHLSGGELATGVDHIIYGWVFFGLVIAVMFAIGMRWREDEPSLDVRSVELGNAAMTGKSPRLLAVGLLSLAVIATPIAVLWHLNSAAVLPTPILDPGRLAIPSWSVTNEKITTWKPAFSNPSAEMTTTLSNGNQRVGLYIAFYRQQDYARKLISSDNVLVKSDDKRWSQIERGANALDLAGKPVVARSGRIRDNSAVGGSRLLVWHWYWINGHLITNDYVGKALTAIARLTGQGDDSAVVMIYTPDLESGTEAAPILSSFLHSAERPIDAFLNAVKSQH